MNLTRQEELLSHLLDGELSAADAEELGRQLNADDALRRNLRQHLALWEIWSQQQVPERSSEAFVQGWKTRLDAESEETNAFSDAVLAQLESRFSRPRMMDRLRGLVGACRSTGLAWAASVLVVGVVLVLWFASTHAAQAVTTIEGEAVCTACTLHESQDHIPAVRVVVGGVTNIYCLVRNHSVAGLQDYFCAGPAPVTAQGKPVKVAGRSLFNASAVTVSTINGPSEPRTNDAKIIFPI